MISIELHKTDYVQIIELLKSLEKTELVQAMTDGYDEEYTFPMRKPKNEPLSEDEGSASEEDVSGAVVDADGFWSLK
tara:strand:+ start:243 stop:473 length:231 start_codon:yes stop_codon:yes gene_type:complete